MSGYFGIPLRNGLPLGLGTVISLRSGASWTPLTLFLAGEQGGWYDPSDLSTMFQDSAGTTPVTAVEQPAGLWLDKRLGALSALGPELVADPSFETPAAWQLVQPTAGSVTVADGNLSINTTDGTYAAAQALTGTTPTVGRTYRVQFAVLSASGGGVRVDLGGVTGTARTTPGTYTSFVTATSTARVAFVRGSGVSAGTVSEVSVREVPGNHLIQPTSASRPTYSKRYNLLLATATLATQSVTVAAGSYTLSFAGAGSITLSGTGSGTYNAGTHTITTTAGSLTLTVSGAVTTADLRRTIHTTMGMPAYQRVTTATDYDESGFLPRLRFDGADDSMYSAASVNFTATDEMTVLAGLTKLSDAGTGIVVEASANSGTTSGTFYVAAPIGASDTLGFRCGGSIPGSLASVGSVPAPATAVVTGLGDISADTSVLRRNGAQVASSASDQGTGNFGNHVLNVGRRNNATSPFNGDIFQLIVRGALTSGADLTSAEQYVAARTGVTLP